MNGQMDIFSAWCEPLKIQNKIRLIELFGGIGSQAKALNNIGANFEHYIYCEKDEYAVTSYNAIHGTNFEPSDITELKGKDLAIIDKDKYTYVLTYSFPCQNLSIAGDREGMTEGSGTNSSLLWEVKRLLEETVELPQVLVMENVPQVLSKNNFVDFQQWVDFLWSLGYTSKHEILNSTSFDIAQNRERCFMVSWLGDYYYDFPKPHPLERILESFLEDEVDKKYFLSAKGIEYVKRREGKYTQIVDKDSEVIPAALTCKGNANWTGNFVQCECIGMLQGENWEKMHDICRRVYSPKGVSPTLHTCGGGGQEPKILDLKVWDMYNSTEIDPTFVGTITQSASHNGSGTFCVEKSNSPLRKLTPRECWRLMGFSDEDFDKAKKSLNDTYYNGKDKSDTQLYRQAGNSIVVNVLMAIFEKLL